MTNKIVEQENPSLAGLVARHPTGRRALSQGTWRHKQKRSRTLQAQRPRHFDGFCCRFVIHRYQVLRATCLQASDQMAAIRSANYVAIEAQLPPRVLLHQAAMIHECSEIAFAGKS